MKTFVGSVIAAVGLVAITPVSAAVVTVTSPAGLYTNSLPVNMAGQTPAYDKWYANNVRSGGSVGITGAHADSGNGSIQFVAPADSNAKADMEYYFSQSFLLSDLTALSYDVYRSSTSTASARYAPALRLYVSDGTRTGYLVYEGAYNGVSVAPVDAFSSVNALPAYIWGTGSLPGAFSVYNRTAADWVSLLPNLRVYGLSVGIGSGWDGTFEGAVDNVTYGTRAAGNTTFNFELAQTGAVPEPASWAMMIGGFGMIGAALRRRKTAVSFG